MATALPPRSQKATKCLALARSMEWDGNGAGGGCGPCGDGGFSDSAILQCNTLQAVQQIELLRWYLRFQCS